MIIAEKLPVIGTGFQKQPWKGRNARKPAAEVEFTEFYMGLCKFLSKSKT